MFIVFGSVFIVVVGGRFVVEAVVVGEVVGTHVQGSKPRVIGEHQGQRRGLVGLLSVLVDEVSHAGQMGGIALHSGDDGAFQVEGAVRIEQLDEAAGEDAEVVVTLRGGEEQGLGRRGGVVEPVLGAVLSGVSLVEL